VRIGIVAPSTPITSAVADQVTALAGKLHPAVELIFHPQCFLRYHHFAGTDAERTDAFVAMANDVELDAVWFARGGYGSCRVAEDAIERLEPAAFDKAYLGYSDAGFLLGGLYRIGIRSIAHGPMPRDIIRDGGDAAVARALDWLTAKSADSLEATLDSGTPVAAFNLTIFSQLLGTALQPDLAGHVLMLEEVSEYMYRIDRSFFHVTGNPSVRTIAGIRLGRCTDVLANDPEFGESEEQIARYWCERSGIAYLGRADIGHDADNKVVPFGRRDG
jgi:muramoyltetrapeptide carboxypeptidase